MIAGTLTWGGVLAVATLVLALYGFVIRLFDRARKAEARMTTLETELRSHLRWHDGRGK